MTPPLVPLEPVERALLHVLRIRAMVFWTILLVVALGAEWLFETDLPMRGIVIGPVLLLAIWRAGFVPAQRWRRWGYAFTGTELHVAWGVWTHVHVIVPVSRVQHIDVSQGLLERLFGVATLTLHTAGTDANLVSLPGVTRDTAESIREVIRRSIGSIAA